MSNCDEHEVRRLPESPLMECVDAASLSVDIGCIKPDPASYLDVLGRLSSIPPAEAVFVGDGESMELSGAKSLGFGLVIFLKQFVAHTGFHPPEKLLEFERVADKTLDEIRVLPSML